MEITKSGSQPSAKGRARIVEPTGALVRVTRACICGSDLWPYNSMPPNETGNWMGHEFIGVYANITIAAGPAPGRAYMHELMPDVLEGRLEPGRTRR